MSKDSSAKLSAGLEALNICLKNDKFLEAEKIYLKLWKDFPKIKNELMYKYGYSLLMSGEYADGDIYLRETKLQNRKIRNKIYFLRAYSKLNNNQPKKSRYYLNKIDENFKYDEKLNLIKRELSKDPVYSKKYKFISVSLSMIIPGSGQAYSGFFFDAVQDFGFNAILGYAAYVSWKHEMGYKRKNRNYIMPILSTSVWGIFYLTNLFNAANAADKANLYNENSYYNSILDKFQIILNDKNYFLNIELNL